jgi:hypothetical protein
MHGVSCRFFKTEFPIVSLATQIVIKATMGVPALGGAAHVLRGLPSLTGRRGTQADRQFIGVRADSDEPSAWYAQVWLYLHVSAMCFK